MKIRRNSDREKGFRDLYQTSTDGTYELMIVKNPGRYLSSHPAPASPW